MTRKIPESEQDLGLAPLKDERRRKELEQLLERIESGSIEDTDDLEAGDLDLLREYYGEGEELQALLDRLGAGEER